MKTIQNEIYRKGCVAGYRDGLKAAESGKVFRWEENDITALPGHLFSRSKLSVTCRMPVHY